MNTSSINVLSLLLFIFHCPTGDFQTTDDTWIAHTVDDDTDDIMEIDINASLTPSVCHHFNISMENCSCTLIHPDMNPHFIQLCQIIESMKGEENTTHINYVRHNATLIYTHITVAASFVGIIGNGAVLTVSYVQRTTMPSCKLHIAELACVNFVFSLIQMVNTIPLYWTNRWVYGLPMCKLLRTLMELSTLLTVLLILVITVERYFLIVHPLDSFVVEGKVKHVAVLISAVCALFTVVPFAIGLGIDAETGRCEAFSCPETHMALPYNWFVLVVYSIVPITFMVPAYVTIVRSVSILSKDSFHRGTLMFKKMKVNRHIVCIAIAVLLLFFLCTLPTRIIFIYMRINFYAGCHFEMDMDTYMTLLAIGYVTFPLQCTLNPILYSMVENEWRRGMVSVLKSFRKMLLCEEDEDEMEMRNGRQLQRVPTFTVTSTSTA